MQEVKLVDLRADRVQDYGLCSYKDVKKHRELQNKIAWMEKYQPLGLRVKILDAGEDGSQGMIEYIPGKFSWRAIDAPGYMVIHCLCIFSKSFRGKGHASRMIDACINDAKKKKTKGVAVVTRKGAWMVSKDLFIKKGFDVVDQATPDFELLALKFATDASSPRSKNNRDRVLKQYSKGLTILWSDQRPYIAKSIKEMKETIAQRYGIKARFIEIKNAKQAQNAPSPYAIFSLIYDGNLLAFHPISNTRFKNIMDKVIK